MTPNICVSILPKTLVEAMKLAAKAESSNAAFIEVRLDMLDSHVDLSALRAKTTLPLIATDKAVRTETEHQNILQNAARSGFEYVDFDLLKLKAPTVTKAVKAIGAKCIVSFHDNVNTPTTKKLETVLKKELAYGADVCKIVTTATNNEDNLKVLNFVAAASVKVKLVCFAMGELGKPSRILSPLFGGFFTFASLGRGNKTAPGQMTISEMKTIYKLLGFT
ncbi:MAG: type I 3-dehydroquinate dehydratase [Candidatus Bathyarchaeota archaeon]|nr:type I 3-dehydroquinate dehydratase [Candidatus Bathyarchaeota archaeon]